MGYFWGKKKLKRLLQQSKRFKKKTREMLGKSTPKVSKSRKAKPTHGDGERPAGGSAEKQREEKSLHVLNFTTFTIARATRWRGMPGEQRGKTAVKDDSRRAMTQKTFL